MKIILLPAIAIGVFALLFAAASSAVQLAKGIGDYGNAVLLAAALPSAIFCAGVGMYLFF